jgi:hypothetical protein
MVQRRSVLISGLALGAAAKVGFFARSTSGSPLPGGTPLSVHITLDGNIYEFNETQGHDLGDYEGPGFVQRCIMIALPDLPLSVFMRPDRGSDRVEVVFELGRLWRGPPRHLGPYEAEILRGGTSLARIEVPQHYWFSRWRWQSARRPVIADVAGLIATGLLPPLAVGDAAGGPPPHAVQSPGKREATAPAPSSPPQQTSKADNALPGSSAVAGSLRRGLDGQIEVVAPPPTALRPPSSPPSASPAAASHPQNPPGPTRPYLIMGLAGITAYMPTTGERDEIGPVTEAQARWICTGSGEAFEQMLAQAEASGTVPWHMRDEKTGAPFDFNQYPKGGWYSDKPEVSNPYVPQLKSPVTPDTAHQPALTYVPFVLTGDPYYLEALQLQMTWCIGSFPPEYRLAGKCILAYGQTRAYAWCLRDLMQLAKVTPASVPDWLMPRAYWERILESNRQWFEETYVQSPAPPYSIFRAATKYDDNDSSDAPPLRGTTVFSPWMDEYLAFILGWTVMIGFPAWRDAFVWKAGSTVARANGKSGWQRAFATPYRICLRISSSSPWPGTWKEAWNLNLDLQKWSVSDPDRFSEPNTAYLRLTRAVLALATRLGMPDAAECYSWADQVIQTSHQRQNEYRWAVPV